MQIHNKCLGQSELRVSRFVLGTANFGSSVPEPEAIRMVHCALDHGVNMIDTADAYGMAEGITGRALAGRADVLVATKVCNPTGPNPGDRGLSPEHISDSLHKSLRRLQRERIDLYQAHNWDRDTPIEITLQAFDRSAREGKIRYTGYSNFTAKQLLTAIRTTALHGLPQPIAIQPLYNLLEREVERKQFKITRLLRMGVLAYSPLAGGVLTGKYKIDVPPEAGTRGSEYSDADPRQAGFIPKRSQRNILLAERLSEISRREGLSNTQLAIGWLLAKPIDCVIVGARNMDQLLEILRTEPVPLSLEHELDRLSQCA